jgi:hypothetical protein
MGSKHICFLVDSVLRLERQLKNSLTFPQTSEGDMKEANLIFYRRFG